MLLSHPDIIDLQPAEHVKAISLNARKAYVHTVCIALTLAIDQRIVLFFLTAWPAIFVAKWATFLRLVALILLEIPTLVLALVLWYHRLMTAIQR